MKHQGRRLSWAVSMALAACMCTTGCSDSNETSEAAAVQTQTSAEKATDSASTTAAESNPAADAAQSETTTEPAETAGIQPLSSVTAATKAEYDEDDLTATYDSFDAEITLQGAQISVTGSDDGVSVSGTEVTISKGGTYSVTGSLTEGQIRITGSEKVKLYLDGVSVTNSNGAAIVCTNEKRTILSLADGTQNSFTDGGTYTVSDTDDTAAAVYAKDKLTINGSGSLTVNGTCSDGIVCKDDLKITGGTVTVDAVHNGVKGTESFSMCGGTLNITAGNDGLKATKTDDPDKGWIAFDGGTVHITAGGDGIQAETTLEIADGTLDVKTNGEIDTTDSGADWGGMMGGGMMGGAPA